MISLLPTRVLAADSFMIPVLLVGTVFIGIDEEVGPQLFTVVPSGVAMGFKACSVGVKQQEATNMLEKRIKQNDGGALDTQVQASIDSECALM